MPCSIGHAIPDVRPEKVADIKTHVDNGTYTIFYEELAERLIEDASYPEFLPDELPAIDQ